MLTIGARGRLSPEYRRSGVYQIGNKVNGKVYVGSAVCIYTRWCNHVDGARKGKHHSVHFQRAWDKYGEEGFDFSVLEFCSLRELIAKEQEWMDRTQCYDYRRGYNISPTAGSSLGVKLSPETCKRISKSKKGVGLGRKMSLETRQKMSVSMRGNTNGRGKKGFKHSDECRRARVKDITGMRFGRLTAISYVESKPHARWLCQCDCGNEVVKYANNLKRGTTRSCGCLLTEILVERNKR